MTELYRELCNLFIRPSRQQYSTYDLGSPILEALGKRKDFDLRNPRGLLLKCSFYEPSKPFESCVVYLHSLNGSRLQSAHLAKIFLNLGISFANLDMSGSGLSQGEYVSLGYHQGFDAKTLIEYIHASYGIKLFGLWGRSMGAVTALNTSMLLQSSPQLTIACAVLDSPYYNLMDLALEIADRRIGLPSILVKAGMLLIKGSIQQRVKFKLQDLEMSKIIKNLRTPLLILASKEDQLINWHHSQKIYTEYNSKEKELFFIKGSHSSARDQDVIQKIVDYMLKNLKNRQFRLKRNLSTVGDQKVRQIISVKSSDNFFAESQSPARRTVRSITPTYIISRKSIQISDRPKQQARFKTQKTIYEQQQNVQTGSTIDIEDQSHLNIISQKLLKMKPRTFGAKKHDYSKTHEQQHQQSPRKGHKLTTTNIGLLKLKKKPNIAPALLQNNKLNHSPYLTNPNLVKPKEEDFR